MDSKRESVCVCVKEREREGVVEKKRERYETGRIKTL